MSIEERLRVMRMRVERACADCDRDPATVEILPVSKRQPRESILEAVAAGLNTLGENRVQELSERAAALEDEDIRWHMIGSLQTNKVSQLLQVPHLAMLQSLDRVKLADHLQSALAAADAHLQVLLQVNATAEASKHGCSVADAPALLRHVLADCPGLAVVGLMAMGPRLGAPEPVFRRVRDLHTDLRADSGLDLPVLSMGMTDDLPAAIAAGSTMVRVGTGLFGPRPLR